MNKTSFHIRVLSTLMLPIYTVEMALNIIYVDHQIPIFGIKSTATSLRSCHATSNNKATN